MDIFAVVALIFSGLVLLFCAWLVISKQKLSARVVALNDKLIYAEARQVKTSTPPAEKQSNHVQKQVVENQQNQVELLELRKENSKLKYDLKKSKEEIKHKENEIKNVEKLVQNKLYILTEENSKLVEQLKSFDKELTTLQGKNKTLVPLDTYENLLSDFSHMKVENSKLKIKLAEFEKANKSSVQKLSASSEKLISLEAELNKWKQTSKTMDGKSLEPGLFLKWHDRAQLGRKMYQLMRQMRELSDDKLTTYQDGVIDICRYILKVKNIPVPKISGNEILADRLLAEAWNAVQQSDLTTPSVVAQEQSYLEAKD